MPEKWTGDAVGKMHVNRITYAQLAERLGCTKAYVSMVLSGYRKPADAKDRFMAAVDELIREKNSSK